MKTIYTVKSQKVSIVKGPFQGGGRVIHGGWGDYTLVETIVAAKKVYWKAQNIRNIRQFNIITSVVSCNCGEKILL